MDRIQRANDFLRLIAEISKNGILIDSNLVYSNLITIGTEKTLIDTYFTTWQNRYSNNPNIDVFVQPDWQYFCQFKSKNSTRNFDDMFKIYIPLDKNHIYHGVNKIFDYISRNNIQHRSKVAMYTRFDDLVIRVDDVDSLSAIRKFVENDPYIVEGLVQPNPFAISDGMIAFAWDGDLSYNRVVSEWISEYINSMQNDLDYVSYSSFVEYVGKRYEEVFVQGKGINSFYKDRKIDNSVSNLVDYQRVTELLLISLQRDSKLSDLYKFYDYAKSHKKEAYENIERLQAKDSLIVEEIPNDIKEAFDYAFLQISTKESPEAAVLRFKRFAKEGNYDLFTRTNGVRALMMETIDIPLARRIIYEEQKNALINSSLETLKKYDTIQLGRAIFGVENDDYQSFTSNNGARERLRLWVWPNEISSVVRNILMEEGYTDIKPNEEYWIFMELISKLKEKSK
ncbi:MAG: hypothetical protein II119_01935 [Bacilli bacterium]|nr:hypothetical protein [Bacilli bacterium]